MKQLALLAVILVIIVNVSAKLTLFGAPVHAHSSGVSTGVTTFSMSGIAMQFKVREVILIEYISILIHPFFCRVWTTFTARPATTLV